MSVSFGTPTSAEDVAPAKALLAEFQSAVGIDFDGGPSKSGHRAVWLLSAQLAQVRHGMVEKTPNPCRMSSGNSWVYTTFAIELETLR